MLRSRSDLLRERRQQSAGASKQPNTISGGSPLPRNKYLSGEAEAPGLAPTVSYVQESDLRAAPPVSEGAGPAEGDPALRAAARVHSLLERSFAKNDSLRALTLTSAVQRADRTRSWTPTRTQSTPRRGTEGERLTASPQATRHTLPNGRVVSVSHRAEEEAAALAEEKWRSAQRIQELELDVKSLHEKLAFFYERLGTGIKDCFGISDDVETHCKALDNKVSALAAAATTTAEIEATEAATVATVVHESYERRLAALESELATRAELRLAERMEALEIKFGEQVAEMQRQVTEALDRSDKNNLEVSEALRECKALCAKAETAAGCGISDSQDEAAEDAGMADLRMHFEGEIAALKKERQTDCTAVAGLRAQLEGDITALRKELSRIGELESQFTAYVEENKATE